MELWGPTLVPPPPAYLCVRSSEDLGQTGPNLRGVVCVHFLLGCYIIFDISRTDVNELTRSDGSPPMRMLPTR